MTDLPETVPVRGGDDPAAMPPAAAAPDGADSGPAGAGTASAGTAGASAGSAGTGSAGTAGPDGARRDDSQRVRAGLSGGWPLGRIIGVGAAVAGLFSVLAIVVGVAALTDLASVRVRVVDTLDPAAYHASQLEVALVNQETGVRGYALTGQRQFLQPYYLGLGQQQRETAQLRQLLAGLPGAQQQLAAALAKMTAWRSGYAEPAIIRVSAGGTPLAAATEAGKAAFDSLRLSLGTLQKDIAVQRTRAVASLRHAAAVLDVTCIGIAVGLVVVLAMFSFGLWRSAILPLSRLAANARLVAGGDFGRQVDSPGGPEEVRDVGLAVDMMRERILAELSAVRAAHATLEARTEDLQRSNSELEQFAYVASHDLQEPLRKVASFCQLLQRRYAGRLDAKADEYIDHAVDGAMRMQALINDLLAFSRVGRTAQRREPVSCALLLAQAWANLTGEVRRTNATIEQGELPVVLGEASLLTAVFQNLLSNALKFRGDEPPRISVACLRQDGNWLFSFTDNGIGIDPGYADRIFVIFQRLHDKATYPGTGIGLAMVRKIIEYHGGQIWLDTQYTSGARFCFTLPVRQEDQTDA